MNGSKTGVVARVSESGTLDLPAEFRTIMGLERGGPVVLRFEDGELRLRAMQSVLEELQEEAAILFAGSGESVARFLSDRRAEAAAERDVAVERVR